MAVTTHNAPEFRHPDEMDWEMGRFEERHQVPVPSDARAADDAECRLPAL